MIGKDTEVVFHDHGLNEPCTPACAPHVNSPVYPPVHYFIRDAGGFLKEVHKLTVPSQDNRGTVLIKILDSGEVKRVYNGSLYRHY